METLHIQLTLTVLSVILFFISKAIAAKLINTYAVKHGYQKQTFTYVNKVLYAALFLIGVSINAIIWNISLEGLSVYFASFFTLFGIAFFAVWSILSNITASVILFFTTPMKIGNKVKIHEGDNSVIGEILDFTLFNIQIQVESGDVVSYPNNLALQKPISLLKK